MTADASPQTTTSDQELIAWIRLARTERVGPATFLQLMRRYGSAAAAVEAAPQIAARARRGPIKVPSAEQAEQELAAGAAIGARLVRLGQPDYPSLLGEIDPPPPTLWVLGDPARLTRRAAAVIGARNASALGMRLAQWIAGDLAAAGVLVVSGLARGVDGAAHRGALDAPATPAEPREELFGGPEGAGGTASVLAGGVDHIYPPEHAKLHAEIAEKGALVSESAPGAPPTQALFRRRNRLISGLARGVVVVEGGERSGSLITASAAADQGRDVFAAPGHPLDPRAAGCNRLIREGATLIRSAEDVLEALAPQFERRPPPMVDPFAFREDAPGAYAPTLDERAADALRAEVLRLLSPSPETIDEVIRRLGAPESAVLWAVTELELAGQAVRGPGGQVMLGDAALDTPFGDG